MTTELSILPPETLPQAEGLSIIPPTADTTLVPTPGPDVTNRASKYHFALGARSPGVSSIESTLLAGQEALLRDNLISIQRQKDAQRRMTNITQAAQTGGVDPRQAMLDFMTQPQYNRNTITEEQFAEKFVYDTVANSRDPDSPAVAALNDNPEQAAIAIQGEANIVARQQIAHSEYEDIKTKNKNMGYFSYGMNLIETMFPVIPALAKNPSSNFMDSLLNVTFPGSSLEAERQKFLSFRDLGEARKWLNGRITEIAKWNPLIAEDFAKHMIEISYDDKYNANIVGVLDVTGTAASMPAFRRALKGASKGLQDGSVKAENVTAARGDLETAGELQVVRQRTAKQALRSQDPVGATEAIWDVLPSSHVGKMTLNSGHMARDHAQKIGEIIDIDFGKNMGAVANSPRAQRIPEENVPRIAQEKKELILNQYPSVQDYVIDHRIIYDQATNSHFIEVIIANRDGSLLKNPAQVNTLLQNTLQLDYRIATIGDNPTDLAKYLSSEASVAKIPLVNVQGDKIQGFKSIQGTVRLNNGTEIKVSNRAEGIYSLETGGVPLKINRENIAAYKNQGKNAPWVDVVHTARDLTKGELQQQGNKWYASIIQPLDETTPLSRQILTHPTGNQAPTSVGGMLINALEGVSGVGGAVSVAKEGSRFLQFLRSAKDIVSPFQRQAREVATHAPTEIQRVISRIANERIGKISKGELDELKVILNRNLNEHSATGQRGKAYQSQADLDKAWLDSHSKLPSDKQSTAYWTYHKLMDLDWTMRNLGVARDLNRQGVQQLEINLGDAAFGGTKVSTPGKFIDDIPWNDKNDSGVLIISKNAPVEFKWKKDISPDEKEMLQGLIKNTHQVHMLANPTDRPLQGTGIKNIVNFVIAPRGDVVQLPLPINLVDYTPGVHVIYPQSWFVKIPMIEIGAKGRLQYFGDKTLFAFNTEVQARRAAESLATLQKMMRDNVPDAEMSTFISKNLPEDLAYWKDKFTDPKTPLNVDMPIRHTFSGQRILENNPKLEEEILTRLGREQNMKLELSNELNSPYNLYRSIDMDFLAHRDGPLNTMTKENAMWKLQTAEVFDPLISLQRGLNNAIRSLHNDHKVLAIESFASQFGHLGTTMTAEQARANPFQFFYREILNENTLDKWELTAAKNVRARTRAFMGIHTETGKDIGRIHEVVMNGLGEKWSRWYDHSSIMAPVRDPISWIRSAIFHPYFGIFNYKQYLVQGQGFVTTSGILTGAHGPVEGAKLAGQVSGMYPMNVWLYLNDSPVLMARADRIAQKMGWGRGQFPESFNAMRQHGFDNVGYEHALRDITMDPGFIVGKGSQFLDAGASFFKWGEALVRIQSWHAAYLEWRKLNPVKPFDIYGQQWVLDRADDLSLSMTRASNSRVQEGIARLPSTFYTFSQRMFEAYAGKRYTLGEKAGMFTVQSAMYGIPTAAGGVAIVDIYDKLQKSLIENNSPIRDMPSYIAATEGFLHWGIYMMTGKQYAFAKRYGPGFPDQLGDILSGKIPMVSWQGIGGAPGGFVERIGKDLYPFVMHAYYGLFGDKGQQYPIVTNDFLALAREVATVNDITNTLMMLNTQKHYSKQGRWLAGTAENPMTTLDAIAIAFGVQTKQVADIPLYDAIMKDQKGMQDRVQQLAERELREAFRAIDKGDDRKAASHYKRADMLINIIGDFDERRKRDTLNKVFEENQPLVNKIQQDFIQRGRGSQIPGRMERLFGR